MTRPSASCPVDERSTGRKVPRVRKIATCVKISPASARLSSARPGGAFYARPTQAQHRAYRRAYYATHARMAAEQGRVWP